MAILETLSDYSNHKKQTNFISDHGKANFFSHLSQVQDNYLLQFKNEFNYSSKTKLFYLDEGMSLTPDARPAKVDYPHMKAKALDLVLPTPNANAHHEYSRASPGAP